MNLLEKSVLTISFNDVVEFCKEKISEGVELDYKQNKPKDLSKHFVSFSNTLGGLIIIGVEEDRKTGVPKSWDGITKEAKDIEWVHQMASMVTPLPSYDVAATDEVDGKVFILVRIYEGPASPYATRNDPTVWIRTGNVSTPLQAANREDLIQLVNKSSNSGITRGEISSRSGKHFNHLLEAAEQERAKAVQDGQTTYMHRLGTSTAMLRVDITPFYPTKQLFDPKDTFYKVGDYIGSEFNNMVAIMGSPKPIPRGIAGFHYSTSTGSIDSLQVYDTGTISRQSDVLTVRGEPLRRAIHISHILAIIIQAINIARHLYKKTSYQGTVVGNIVLTSCKDSYIYRVKNGGFEPFDDQPRVLLDSYVWPIELDTYILSNIDELTNFVTQLALDIHWDMGESQIDEATVKDWIIKNKSFGS